jgi:hypothetical protein
MGQASLLTLAPQKHHTAAPLISATGAQYLALKEVRIDLNKALPLFGDR